MNTKEIGEIRRRQRRDRSNMTAIFGCYVNDQKEIVSEFKRSTGIMPENEAGKYFSLLRRVLKGSPGKNHIDITFRTSQVADSPEHKLLMDLRGTGLEDTDTRNAFYQKIIENLDLGTGYLILLGRDAYDVPFKSKDDVVQADNSAETYTYILCAICPVKQTKAVLHYEPESKDFQDGNMVAAASAPALGFLFPAFDDRATNIYNALYYTHSQTDSHEAFVSAVFNTAVAAPAETQRETFSALLSQSLEEECSMEVVQAVQDRIGQQVLLHKESKATEPLKLAKVQLLQFLDDSNVSQKHLEDFSTRYDVAFGASTELYPDNIIDSKKLRIRTDDVDIRIPAEKSELIQTRIIGGVKYLLIQADETVEVNGIPIQIGETVN